MADIAGQLNARGVGRGDRVAIVLPNGPEMATAFLAVAATATTAPLNPGLPRGRARFLPHRHRRQGDPRRRGRNRPGGCCRRAARHRGGQARSASRRCRRHIQAGGRCDRRTFAAPACGGRRHRVAAAHVRHHVAPETGSAQPRQPGGLGCAYRRNARACRRRSLPQHHAAVPHSRADRGGALLAGRGRQRLLHARLQRSALFPVARRGAAELVHGGADDAPGDPGAGGAQPGRAGGRNASASSARRPPRCRRRSWRSSRRPSAVR